MVCRYNLCSRVLTLSPMFIIFMGDAASEALTSIRIIKLIFCIAWVLLVNNGGNLSR